MKHAGVLTIPDKNGLNKSIEVELTDGGKNLKQKFCIQAKTRSSFAT